VITPEKIAAQLKQMPTIPTTAVKLAKLARDERSSAADFEQAIRPDPALTANLLRIVNSAYFGLRSRAETVRQAVTLLGVKRTSELASAAGFAPIVPARLPGYEMDAATFWLHCVAVAVLSERLCAELGVARPDLIFTAGLLHDIGKLGMGVFVSQSSEQILGRVRGAGLSFVAAEREVLGTDHTELGAAVATAWSLPEAVVNVARWHHKPGDAPAGDMRTLVDVVHTADALAHALGLGMGAGELAITVDPETETRLGIRARRLERVAGDSLEEIHEMARLFTPAGGAR
jgi:putative nucleotidyltransferase with HDIG domain